MSVTLATTFTDIDADSVRDVLYFPTPVHGSGPTQARMVCDSVGRTHVEVLLGREGDDRGDKHLLSAEIPHAQLVALFDGRNAKTLVTDESGTTRAVITVAALPHQPRLAVTMTRFTAGSPTYHRCIAGGSLDDQQRFLIATMS